MTTLSENGQLPHPLPATGAIFSPCDHYRFALWRVWQPDLPRILFIGLNPSTADASQTDPTIRRCLGFAHNWGFGGAFVCNLYAFRTPYRHELAKVANPVGPGNDEWLATMRIYCDEVLFCWGNGPARICFPTLEDRVSAIWERLTLPAFHLGLTKAGNPRHPLYLKASTPRRPYS